MTPFTQSRAFLITAACIVAASTARAQPIDTFKFKGTHNSYERGMIVGGIFPFYDGERVPLWEQVLRYNAWAIELDICKLGSGEVVVRHACTGLLSESWPLQELLDELMEKPEINERFTFFRLQVNGNLPESLDDCCTGFGPWGPANDTELWNLIAPTLTAAGARIYTPIDLAADNPGVTSEFDYVWPSVQSLTERGFAFAIFHNRAPNTASQKFFKNIEGPTDDSLAHQHLATREDGDLLDGDVAAAGDRILFATYPGWFGEDFIVGAIIWNNSIDNGINLIMINEYDASYTYGDGTYCSFPLYVDPAHEGDLIGTRYLPFTSIAEARTRIQQVAPVPSEPITLRLRAGHTYEITPAMIHGPITLKAYGSGDAVIVAE